MSVVSNPGRMPPGVEDLGPGWSAALSLAYARDGERTIPVLRRHHGPLRIQKGLTPEGAGLWHQIIVHPPGGIAGGDRLAIDVSVKEHAHALLTTPGASKWYRSTGAGARQSVLLDVADGASLEWLPMESIVFDGAHAEFDTEIRLHARATLIAFELTCLGRPAGGHTFDEGLVRSRLRITRGQRLIFSERGAIRGCAANGRAHEARAGLAGAPMYGTFFAVSCAVNDGLLEAARGVPVQGELAVTRIGEMLIARWRGARSDQGLQAFRALWAALRPALLQRPECRPRIWNT